MKRFAGLVFVLGMSQAAFGTQYKLDTSHATMGFKIRHMGLSWVTGQFGKSEGMLQYDEKKPEMSNISVKIDTASIDTNEPKRDEHLKSPDFFDVKKYPDLKFESTKVVFSAGKPTQILGKLTIRGITKEVALDITDWGGTMTDPWGNERMAFEASGKIDRTQWGLTWNKGLSKAGGLMVGNDVTLMISAEFVKNDKPS
ncbi:MAG: YceI family protein [Oligoflexales bacterium]